MNQSLQPAIDAVMPAALATGLFQKASVTIQIPDGQLTDNGTPSGNFVDVAGLIGIVAMVAPPSVSRIMDSTSKTISVQQATNAAHVLLGGYYPDVETAWRGGGQAVVDGVLYSNQDILSVESDSQATQTRMYLRVVTE